MAIAEDTYVIGPEDRITEGGRKVALVLAIVIFVGATLLAVFYDRLVAPLKESQKGSAVGSSISQFQTNLDFLSYIHLSNNVSEVSITDIPVIDEVIPEKESLVRDNDTLYVNGEGTVRVTADSVSGFNLDSDSANWSVDIVDGAIISSKLNDGAIYLDTVKKVSESPTCPIPLYRSKSVVTSISCDQIYTNRDSGANTLYSVISIDAASGEVNKTLTILAGRDDTSIYLGKNKFYVLQNIKYKDATVLYNFLTQKATVFLPPEIITQIQKLNTYEISSSAKLVELETLIKEYYNELSGASQESFFSNYSASLSKYLSENADSLGQTSIFEFDPDMTLTDMASVNGYTIKDSVHEYNGSLHFLTTATDGPAEYISSSILYKIRGRNITKITLGYYPEGIAFGNNWMFTKNDGTLNSINLTSFTLNKQGMEGEYIIFPYDNYFAVVTPKGGSTEIKQVGSGVDSTARTLNESWSGIKKASKGASYNQNLFFLPGEEGDYLVSSSNLLISQNSASTSPEASYMSEESLYILAKDIYVINTKNGTTTDRLNVLY